MKNRSFVLLCFLFGVPCFLQGMKAEQQRQLQLQTEMKKIMKGFPASDAAMDAQITILKTRFVKALAKYEKISPETLKKIAEIEAEYDRDMDALEEERKRKTILFWIPYFVKKLKLKQEHKKKFKELGIDKSRRFRAVREWIRLESKLRTQMHFKEEKEYMETLEEMKKFVEDAERPEEKSEGGK